MEARPPGSRKEKQCFDLSRLLLLGWPFRYRLCQLCVKGSPAPRPRVGTEESENESENKRAQQALSFYQNCIVISPILGRQKSQMPPSERANE